MNQNGIYDDQKFQCNDHPQHSMKLICYTDKCPYKRRFICIQCIFDQQKDLQGIATIQDFIYNPINVLDKTKEFDKFTSKNNNFDQILQKLEELEISLVKCRQDIIKKLSTLKMEIQKLKQIQQQQNQNELVKSIRIDEFQQQLQLVWNLDTHQGTKEFEQLEQQLNSLIVNWRDCCNKKITEISNIQQSKQIDISSILLHFNDDIQKQQTIFENIQKSIPYDQNIGIKQFVHNEISKGKTIRYDLIYSGIRDGLTIDSYYKMTNFQQQLLTIINIKNGNIVGAYTPCQLNSSINNWVVDNTNQSFIFQYNKEEIYKLKNNIHTLWSGSSLGPWYGFEGEIGINQSFILRSKSFGVTYDITGYKVDNKQTHLIGDKDTEVIECKVYKITFL